jgi:alkyl sulfatase BDS1-like metallo-beta-lactamase superfamily hydrolase
MKKNSRRHFLASSATGAAAITLSGSLPPFSQANASNFEYKSPAQMPFSQEREKANQTIARAPKAQVVKVRDHVYTAVSYALAAMILVETPEGSVIIDTTESLSAAQTIMAEFRKISDKPVKAVIYTHNHADHFRGTKALFEPGMKVISHKDFMTEVKLQEARGKSGAIRSAAMFGLINLPHERNSMVFSYPSPFRGGLIWEAIEPKDLIWPNLTFENTYSFQLGGVSFNLIHAPGETPDQIIVSVPEYKVVCCADNFYASFPNLYTIRGTSSRPVVDWAKAQDKVIALDPEFLVPGHGLPIDGRETIKEVLANYRDAILHVHKIALDAVQQFKPIDVVVAQATLPPQLASLPYLEQSYGSVPYSVRSIYESYIGWFDGDPVNLFPLSRKALGAEVLAIAGSADKILRQADEAQKEGRHQAVLELCEMVLASDPKNRTARLMKIDALLALSKLTANFPTATYYDTFAKWEQFKLEEG